MGSDPEPYDPIVNLQAQSSPANTHADGIHRLAIPNEPKLQTGMRWIFLPQSVVLPRKALNSRWKLAKAYDEILGDVRSHSSSNPIS
jgi:hypothetical protein